MARRPDRREAEVLTKEDLADLRYNLAHLRMRANAKVVYVDPDRPRVCGIALEKPENVWGVIVPPDDW